MAHLATMMQGWRCRRLTAALVDYCDGALGAAERDRVERHVAHCPHCAAAIAALRDVPVLLGPGAEQRDDAFWEAQRRQVMARIDAPSDRTRQPLRGFDWRLTLPVAAAAAIALAGYLSLRAPSAPGAAALNVLDSEDAVVLIEVADDIVPAQELLLDAEVDSPTAAVGAFEAGWIGVDDAPSWADLDDEELDALQGMTG